MPAHKKTHCIRGHEFTPENTYIMPNGSKSCKACRLSNVLAYTDRNREKVNEGKRQRRRRMTKKDRRVVNLKYIGWTWEGWIKVIKAQKGKCAICKKTLTFEDKISGSRACADHEHSKPPKPRGVLCANCNLGIGNLQDSVKVMRSAIAYIEKYGG